MRRHALLSSLLLSACFVQAPTPCEPPGGQVASPRAAGCMTVEQGRLLLVRTSGGWAIPGGYVEAGEDSAQAAVRETKEEAGIDAIAGPPVCAVVSKGFVAHACATPADLPTPTPDGQEVSDARWMTRAEVEALSASELRFPDQKSIYVAVLMGAEAAEQRLGIGQESQAE